MYHYYPQFINIQREYKLCKITQLCVEGLGLGKPLSLTLHFSSLDEWIEILHKGIPPGSQSMAGMGKIHQKNGRNRMLSCTLLVAQRSAQRFFLCCYLAPQMVPALFTFAQASINCVCSLHLAHSHVAFLFK